MQQRGKWWFAITAFDASRLLNWEKGERKWENDTKLTAGHEWQEYGDPDVTK